MKARFFPNHPGRRLVLAWIATCCLAATQSVVPATAGNDVVMFAASSLKTALDAIAERYREQTGTQILISYAGTPTLARQIGNGAPADLVMAADETWMDYLEERQLIRPETRHTLLGNSLVLIVPTGRSGGASRIFDVPALLGRNGRLALANTRSVPAGRYALQALRAAELWDQIANRTVESDNVRAALAFVVRAEAPAGIVYATDARAEAGVEVIAELAPDSHAPIRYPVALTSLAGEAAMAFFDYLRSPAAAAEFRQSGFIVLGSGG
jgi:molybdate transport system substrate-binding protein